jgi:hypothetical protein
VDLAPASGLPRIRTPLKKDVSNVNVVATGGEVAAFTAHKKEVTAGYMAK